MAVNLAGYQTIVRELRPEALGDKWQRDTVVAAAEKLGGSVDLEPRLRQVEFRKGVHLAVVVGDPPRMVLTVLVEAFGIEKARDYAQHNLIPYFLACGAHVEGLSRNAGQPAQVDNPEQSLDNSRQRRDE